ncbi:MAG: zinc ribbon domain-containing protein [Chloroflexi bacterium]|nr:MAG: zinc ribbon domain-containing protein [Chloroflexota bacterium]
MKLPPVALTAPTLCPRCDAPALYEDRCTNCGLQLAKCGACQGVAGPFDRYCGFCGHDLAAGELRSPVWRFWLLVAMIPMVAALVIGATVFGGPAATRVGRLIFPVAAGSPAPPGSTGVKLYRSPNLQLVYAVPADWTPADYTLSKSAPMPFVGVSRIVADGAQLTTAKGDVLATKPSGALLTMGTPRAAPPGVDATDPSSVLGSDISSLTLKPPGGLTITVFRQAQTINVGGRSGKEAVLKVVRGDGGSYYLERAYLVGPSGLFEVNALVPQSDWEAGDDHKVEAIIQSLRLG